VEEDIVHQFPKFEEVGVGEIGCGSSWVGEPWGDDATVKGNKGLAREVGNGGVVARALALAAVPCFLVRGGLVGQEREASCIERKRRGHLQNQARGSR
jgi:hypothetical protein